MADQSKHQHGTESETGQEKRYSYQERAGILVLLGSAACVLGYMLSLDAHRRHWTIIAYFAAWVLFGAAIAAVLWEPKQD
jgi:protein-S-isoprenylcysteine O-methyltransferase Ste14